MWIGVHEIMFTLDPKVTQKIIKQWICITPSEENSPHILDVILEHIKCEPNYYDELVKIVESEFIFDTSLLMPKVK